MASTFKQLVSNVQAFATAVGQEIKKTRVQIGSLSNLQTDVTTDLVTAINSIKTEVQTLESQVSGDEAKLGDLSDLSTQAKNSLVAAVNELNGRTPPAGSIGTNASLTTDAKDSLVAAINEVHALAKSPGDVDSKLQALKEEIVGGASGAYDTLKELETALQSKSNASDVVQQLTNVLRYDNNTALSEEHQNNVAAKLGVTAPDFAATFRQALA